MQKMLHHLKVVSVESCTGHLKKIYGLPCRHDTRQYQVLNTGVPLELAHQQWILRWPTQNYVENDRHEHLSSPRSRILRTVHDMSTAQQLSRKCWLHSWKMAGYNRCCTWKNRMLVRSRRGRPADKRDKSLFEHVESSFVNYKCSICGKVRHNERFCVN
jgi:hypothetical protein